MRNMEDIMKVFSTTAKNAVMATKPTTIVYGKVINVDPLEIWIDQTLTIKDPNIKLTRAVMDFKVEMTVDHLTENRAGGSGDAEFASHNHAYVGRKEFLVHNALVMDDEVIMIQVQGGQDYIVIDKVARP